MLATSPPGYLFLCFHPVGNQFVTELLNKSSTTLCFLDPMPTPLVKCALPRFWLAPFRIALTLFTPVLKKSRTDPEDFYTFCPISIIFLFHAKLIEYTVAIQLQAHISKTNYERISVWLQSKTRNSF